MSWFAEMSWFLRIFILYLVLIYHLNLWMMHDNAGLYNAPAKTWGMCERCSGGKPQKASDAQSRRAWCLVASPIFVLVSGFHYVADGSIPEEY